MRASTGIVLLWHLGSWQWGWRGCSGTGAPSVAPELASLRALANDQVAAVLLIKHWFSLLYPPDPPPKVASSAFRLSRVTRPGPGDTRSPCLAAR